MSGIDPKVELVRNAIGYGVMMALEGKDELFAKLVAQGPEKSLADALTGDAEKFINTRPDLFEALSR